MTRKHNPFEWDPSLSLLPSLISALPGIIEMLNQPVLHHHTHEHTHTIGQPSKSNPYRSTGGTCRTVGDLEQWILDKPKDPELDRLLQLLARYPQDTPLDRVKHLLK